MPRPSRLKFFGRDLPAGLDRILEALAYGGADDAQAGSRLLRFFTFPAPVPAESAIRADESRPAPIVVPADGSVVPATTDADVARESDQATLVFPDTAAAPTIADPQALPVAGDERSAIALLGGTLTVGLGGAGAQMSGAFDAASRYVVLYNDNLDPGLVVDRSTMTLLEGGVGDHPELGRGNDDILVLRGDFSAGFSLSSQPRGIDTIVVAAGNDFSLTAADAQVDAGRTMEVDAMPLGAGNHIMFDGSAETDGRFVFFGGDGGDIFLGGAGNDRISGRGGADMLAGGGGRDTFAYLGASESTGAAYDTLGDFDAVNDRIDLQGNVSGFHAPIEGGTLSLATFDNDLAAALGGLGASQAAWFAPDAGDLAGQIFLIVDANGVAGYQEGEDYVFAVSGTPLADLSGHTDIFV